MAIVLALVLLAQAPSHWVTFEICQLDGSTTPPTAKIERDKSTFTVRANVVVGVGEIRPEPQGLECSEIATSSNRQIYVIGTVEEVIRKLDG